MEEKQEQLSRPVRIKFKKSGEVVEGQIIFDIALLRGPDLAKLLTMIRFRPNDELQTETLFSMMDIAMIEYL